MQIKMGMDKTEKRKRIKNRRLYTFLLDRDVMHKFCILQGIKKTAFEVLEPLIVAEFNRLHPDPEKLRELPKG